MPGVSRKHANARSACRLTGLNVTGPNSSGPLSGVRLTIILGAAALLASAAVGFAQPAGNNKPANKPASAAPAGKTAPAGNAQPQTDQQEQQVFGQLAKAWTDYLAGSLAGAREAAEKLTRSSRETVRKEAAYLLARCLWDSGSDESRAVARKTWDDLGKDKTESGIQMSLTAAIFTLKRCERLPRREQAGLTSIRLTIP